MDMVDYECLNLSMLKNIFPLDTKTQDYHLKYPIVLLQTS